eukprot:jgi/Chlat1/7057/Chrsp56S06674
METSTSQLPLLRSGPDVLRQGLQSLKSDALGAPHPLEKVLQQTPALDWERKRTLLALTYGEALPLQMEMERQILSKFARPAGLPSGYVGLDSLTGALDELDLEDYLNDSRESEFASQVDFHTAMEAKLGLSKGLPARRRS